MSSDLTDIIVIGGLVYLVSRIPKVTQTIYEAGYSTGEVIGQMEADIQEITYKTGWSIGDAIMGWFEKSGWTQEELAQIRKAPLLSWLMGSVPPIPSGGGGSSGAG